MSIKDATGDQEPSTNIQMNLHSIQNPNNRAHVSRRKNKKETRPYLKGFYTRSLYRSLIFRMRAIDCWTIKTAIIDLALFAIMAIIVAVLIVCFRTSKSSVICEIKFKEAIENSFINNSHPLAVAVGHFNNDSWADIAVANSGTNEIGIFLGFSNRSFAAQIKYSTGSSSRPMSIAVGDFNHDQWVDIVVANYDSHTLGVLLGHGDGAFSNQTTIFTGASRPLSVAVGHFNNDTWLDIVIANNGTNSIGIIFGNENESFGMQTIYSTGYDSLPCSVAVGDVNKDNKLDIIVANYGTDNVGIFYGHDNGSFALKMMLPTSPGSGPYSVAVADVNNDDRLDIIVANYRANNVGVFLGYGNGKFTIQKTYFLGFGSNPCFVAVGYIDKDNYLDVVVSNNGTNSVSVLVGYGNGTFVTPTIHSTSVGSSPVGLAIGDFDNDQQSDVVVSNFGTNNILTFIGYTTISSKNPLTYSTGDGSVPVQVALSDFNNDTYMDIAVANYGTNIIGILLGNGNESFGQQTSCYTGDGSSPTGLAIGDVNNDNFLDIVVSNYNVGYASSLLGYGNGSFAVIEACSYAVSSSPMMVAAGDFNNDSYLDIVLPSLGFNTITIYLGYGNGSFGYLETYTTGDGSRPTFVAIGDFNNDNHPDIVVANTYLDNIGIFLNYGNGTFSTQTTYLTEVVSAPQSVGLADLNNDTCLDLAVANTGTGNVGIFLGYCNGTFSTIQMKYATNSGYPYWITVGDVNNDQWLDLVVANVGLNSVGVFLGYGNGSFSDQLSFSSGSNSVPYNVAIGDLNNDDRLDVVTANHGTNNIAVLFGHPDSVSRNQTTYSDSITYVSFNNSTPHSIKVSNENTDRMSTFLLGDYYFDFINQTIYSTGSSARPYSIVVDDFNHDTFMDIVAANSGNGNIGVLLGYGNESFATETTYSTGSNSRPQHIVSGDLNKDTYLDIAVANPLDNTIRILLGNGNGSFAEQSPISTGSGSNPSSMALGDINGDSWLDFVVTNRGTNSIGLMLAFSYPSFQNSLRFSCGLLSGPFAVAIADFNNDNQLDIATANHYTNNVGIILGHGNGSFTPPMTYALVDGAHPWLLATGDFNNDNKVDLTVAIWGLNLMGVLFGNGDGTFGKPLVYPTGAGTRPLAVTVGDFNNDNHLDITTANYGGSSVSVFLGYGNGTFTNATNFSTGNRSGPSSIITDDLNKDNNLDIIVANGITSSVGVLYGNGDGTFRDVAMYMTPPNSSPQYAASGDFNNDSLPDMAVAILGTGDIGVFLGYGNGTFSSIVLYSGDSDSGSQYLAIADLNNDGFIDIAVVNPNTGNIGILCGHGDGIFQGIDLYSLGSNSGPYAIAIADFNKDTKLDMAVADFNHNEVVIYLGNGRKPFGSYTPLLSIDGARPSSIVMGDLNNDTRLDIAIANSGTNNIGILLGYGNGSFEDIKMYSTGNDSQPSSICLGDFNKDTLLDIAVANFNTNSIAVYFATNNGTFENLTIYSTGIASNPVSIAVDDFNHDSFLDIVVANSGTNNIGVFMGYDNGIFANQISYPMGYNSRPNSVAFGDFNNDSWLDIAVSNYDTDSIKILFNCPRV